MSTATGLPAHPGLAVDRQAHEYWLHERRLPSVTDVLSAVGLIDRSYYHDEAARRGRAVHRLIQRLEGADVDIEGPDEKMLPSRDLVGYRQAYCAFREQISPGAWKLLEEPLCDAALGYAGTPDQVRWMLGTWAVIDIKTGEPAPWHRLQTAAYKELVRPYLALAEGEIRRYALYLEPSGRYMLARHDVRADWSVFRAALTVAQWRGCSPTERSLA